ncbi:MAG: hypothetical protein IJ622_01795 [Bacteroidales bacterium]|nr:hypothetical protein [Bacteroidales bacterium]
MRQLNEKRIVVLVCNLNQESGVPVFPALANADIVLVVVLRHIGNEILHGLKTLVPDLFAVVGFNMNKAVAFPVLILVALA